MYDVTEPPAGMSLGETAFAEMFRAHFQGLLRLATLLGADDPENVVQEAFVRLHGSRRRLRDAEAALGYLRAIVGNLSRSRLRHLRVVRRHAVTYLPDAGSAEQAAVLREDQREVLAALAAMPARQREALVLRYWADMGGAEIAAAMGISVGAVKSHLARGKAALEKMLEERA